MPSLSSSGGFLGYTQQGGKLINFSVIGYQYEEDGHVQNVSHVPHIGVFLSLVPSSCPRTRPYRRQR